MGNFIAMNVVIKKIRKTQKNLVKLRQLDRICFPDDNPPLAGLRKYHCWFAYIDEEIVGYAISGKLRNHYFLERCGILPQWRGNKIQRLLINERIEYGKNIGFQSIATYTSSDNVFSIKNLKSCGFVEWLDAPKYIRRYNKKVLFIIWRLNTQGTACCP